MERQDAHLCGATIYLAETDLDLQREISTLHLHSGKETTSYALTPTMMKHLYDLLAESISSYEQTYGPILSMPDKPEHIPHVIADTTKQIQEVVDEAQHVLEQIQDNMRR